jgi:hypothetical protein
VDRTGVVSVDPERRLPGLGHEHVVPLPFETARDQIAHCLGILDEQDGLVRFATRWDSVSGVT